MILTMYGIFKMIEAGGGGRRIQGALPTKHNLNLKGGARKLPQKMTIRSPYRDF